ncbi:hypothetical protein CHH54_03630 [Bacillus sp. 7520-S]|nr:hypothetical protein CHH54_03630 [Bacillus sp. 7520-S]
MSKNAAEAKSFSSSSGIIKAGFLRLKKASRAFTEIFLEAGETKTVILTFDTPDFVLFEYEASRVVFENGTYEICVVTSAADIFFYIKFVYEYTMSLTLCSVACT